MAPSVGKAEMLEVLRQNGITSQQVLDAMAAVPREEFVRSSDRISAYENRALPIEFKQSISQPLMVAIIVQALDVVSGSRVLDIGTGSGYQAAVLAECGARVVSIERIADLAKSARDRLSKLGYNADVRVGDGGFGAPDAAPFDAIAVAAAVPRAPDTLIYQLALGGRAVYPQARTSDVDELVRATLSSQGPEFEDLGACRFVHLVGHQGYES
jgi:protein-L-isoaspartate(D-aspartate) O-methyltransferase